jgi:hypothetical protein
MSSKALIRKHLCYIRSECKVDCLLFLEGYWHVYLLKHYTCRITFCWFGTILSAWRRCCCIGVIALLGDVIFESNAKASNFAHLR